MSDERLRQLEREAAAVGDGAVAERLLREKHRQGEKLLPDVLRLIHHAPPRLWLQNASLYLERGRLLISGRPVEIVSLETFDVRVGGPPFQLDFDFNSDPMEGTFVHIQRRPSTGP